MAIKNYQDLRGGYALDIPSELMTDNELLRAENCWWRNGITKRNGISLYDATDFSSMVGIKGSIRAYINSTWYTILAVDDDSYVHFYAATTTSFTVIDADFHFTKGINVEFAELLGHVVAVNGTEKPAVIYWDSALVIENLEAYDERERSDINWFAGQWEDSLVQGYQEVGLTGKTATTETGLTATSYGYQECGLSGKTTTTETGLTAATTYWFRVGIDGEASVEYSIVTGASTIYSSVLALMNAIVAGATFAIVGGDLRCTSATLGTGSKISLSSGGSGTDLVETLTDFVEYEAAVNGATQVYYFKVNVDGTGSLEYSITMGTISLYAAVLILMNAQIGTAVFALVGGDLRCTSNLVGTSSAIDLAAGTTGTNLFATLTGWSAFDTAVAGSVASHFVDDSDDAKDLYEKDFQLANTEANDGCYISCDYTFNKVVFKGAAAAGGAPVAEYSYWGADGWTSLGSLVSEPTWTDAEGDKTLEFNLPLDADGVITWEKYGEDDDTTGIVLKYIIRIRFTTAPSAAFSCDRLVLSNTQYLTQILQDERPHLVRMHNSQIYMASNNIVNFSSPWYVTGWHEANTEHFDEGGAKIMDMKSFADMLVVGKEHTIYTWTTSDLMNPVRSRPLTTVGPISARSMVQIANIIMFVADDGIYLWDGTVVTKVSKHIRTDIEAWTLTDTSAVVYKGECWITFPTNSVVLVFDPDTFRLDDMGDGRVSFYKFTGYKVTQFLNCNGAEDIGYLLGVVDQAEPYVARCDYGTQDNITAAVNIDMRCQTKYFSQDTFQTNKGYGRIKVKLREVSAHAGERHRLTMFADDGIRYEYVGLYATKGTGYYTEDVRVPYTIDGKLLSLEMRHNGPTGATLIGYSVEVFERSY